MKSEKALTLVLAGVSFTTIMDFMIMMPLGPQFKRSFDIGPAEWSALISSYALAAAVSGTLAIFFLDAFDRRRALLFLYGGFIISTCLVGLSQSYGTLLLSRSSTGFFGGIIGALLFSIIADLVPPERRGSSLGILMTGFSAAASLGVPTGLALGTAFGWRMAFFLIAALAAVLYVLVWRMLPVLRAHLEEKEGVRKEAIRGVSSVLKSKNRLKALLFMILIVFGQFSIIPFIAPSMVANVGFEEIELTYIYFAGGSLTIFSSPWFGRLSDRFGKQRMFGILMVISLIPIYAITHMEPMPMVYVLIFTSMFFVFAAGRMVPASAVVIGTAHPRYRGSFMSLRSVAVSIGQALAAWCAGWIITEGVGGRLEHFNIVGYIGIATSVICFFVLRTIKSEH